MTEASKQKPRKALGRGLSSLISTKPVSVSPQSTPSESTVAPLPPHKSHEKSEVGASFADNTYPIKYVQVSDLIANPDQPRKSFDGGELQELSNSIINHGLIQPILTRPVPGQKKLMIVAGERRYRAAELAKLTHVPVIIRDLSDSEVAEIALIENVQRSDLNPLEEAAAYQKLMADQSLTQTQVAERVGKDRTTVSNTIRLLSLDPEVRELLLSGKLSAGHAKAIVTVKEPSAQRSLAKKCLDEGLSVRAIEQIVSRVVFLEKPKEKTPSKSPKTSEYQDLERRLRNKLGTKVNIQLGRKGNGKIELSFYSAEELTRLIDLLDC